MSAAGKAENTEAAAAAEPGPPVSWDLGVDITVAIANLITEENSPFFDEADIASVAASCMCVGHPTFTSIAEILYQFLSPRFGDDPGVSEGSSVGELKAVLKSWGRPCTGKKSELWSRILDEVEGDSPAGTSSFAASAAAAAAAATARSAAARRSAAAAAAAAGPSTSNAAAITAAPTKAGRKRAADAATVPAAKQAKAAGDGGGGKARKASGKASGKASAAATARTAAEARRRPVRRRRCTAAVVAAADVEDSDADTSASGEDGAAAAGASSDSDADVEVTMHRGGDNSGGGGSDSEAEEEEEAESSSDDDYEGVGGRARSRRRGGGGGGGRGSRGKVTSKGKGGKSKGPASGGRGGGSDSGAVAATEARGREGAAAAELAKAEAAEAAAPQCRCPIARGPKRRIIELQNARVTKSRAKEVYGLYQSLLQELPTRLTQLQAFGGFRAETYALKDVKRLAVKKYTSYREFFASQQKSKQASREFSERYTNAKSQRQNMVKDILMRRGVAADAAEAAVNHVWHLDFFTAGVQYGAEAPVAMEPEWLRLNSEAAADEAHTYIFHVQHTNFRSHLANLRATHTYARSGSKYRQDVALEKRAFAMALQEWVAGRRLEDLVADARLPPHMRPAAEQALRAVADGSAAAERERLREAVARRLAAAGGGGGGGVMQEYMGMMPYDEYDDDFEE